MAKVKMLMVKQQGKIKYFAYLRKSSEDKERQALSIPAQKDKLKEMFGDLDIEFIEEEKSAFIPHNRPKFLETLARIRNGERQGLIAWHPDRLSRNEVDASSLTYMIRTGELQSLKLATYHFENTPEGIWMLQMALSQSQYESAKKGRDVKRGLDKKARMGIYPAPAPMGYVNDKYSERGSKTIEIDPERFDLTRKMVDLMLTGKYSVPQIHKIANDDWGFRSKKGKKISRSNLYNIFTRPFYYGEFEYPVGSGNWHKGTHKPLMTKEEYDRIQFLLGRPSASRVRRHNFAYRGPMHCGECGALVTAELKFKKLANGDIESYIYYHCTKRKNPNCSQGSIEELELEKLVAKELDTLVIPEDFTNWAMARLKEMNEHEVADREKIYGGQRKGYESCLRKIDNLIDMRANGELDEDEFRSRKQTLLEEKARYQELLKDTDKRVENWLEVAERGFNFAEKARAAFEIARRTNDLELKKEIFSSLGSNYTFKDGKLSISLDDLLMPIKTASEEARRISKMLEPKKKPVLSRRKGDFYTRSAVMLPDLDSNQDTRLQRAMSYH
jgi:site-specific DNA recombinase